MRRVWLIHLIFSVCAAACVCLTPSVSSLPLSTVPAGGLGGTASVAPLRAVLKAERREGSLHVRPLYTAGDLMLALFELMDPLLFSRGYIQLPGDLSARDAAGAWSEQANTFRVSYRVGRPNRWEHLVPSRKFDLRNEDLPPFLCPHLCPAAFDAVPVPPGAETVEMKVWVSNLVRSYKLVHELGGDGDGSLRSLTVDVQAVRHVEDAYLYSSQVRRPTKAELRAQVRAAAVTAVAASR